MMRRLSSWAFCMALVGMTLPAFGQDEERPERPERPGFGGRGGPEGGRGGPEGGRGRGGGFGGRGGGDFNPADMIRRLNPMFAAIDKDEDGSLSASEIEAAVAAIKALDTDGDGKVSAEEVRPQFGGSPGGGPPGGRGGPPRGEGGPRPEGGGSNAFMDRMKGMDKNGDGSLTKDELGERGERMMEFGDTNKDGKIDNAEMENMANRASGGRGGRPGGGRPGGEGGRPSRGEGERPARPEAE